MKKIIALILAVCLVFALCACNVKTTKTESVTENGVTTTTTTTNTNGQVETTTTTSSASEVYESDKAIGKADTIAQTSDSAKVTCGDVAKDGQTHKVSMTILNQTGGKIKNVYFRQTDKEKWSYLLEDNEYLGDGYIMRDCCVLPYDKDHLNYDLAIKTGDGKETRFDPISFDTFSADGILIVFTKNDAGSYGWVANDASTLSN